MLLAAVQETYSLILSRRTHSSVRAQTTSEWTACQRLRRTLAKRRLVHLADTRPLVPSSPSASGTSCPYYELGVERAAQACPLLGHPRITYSPTNTHWPAALADPLSSVIWLAGAGSCRCRAVPW